MYTPFVGIRVTFPGAVRCGADRDGCESGKLRKRDKMDGRRRGAGVRLSTSATDDGLTVITPQCRDAVEMKNNGNPTCYGYFQEIKVMR